jgi:hypothetical protein
MKVKNKYKNFHGNLNWQTVSRSEPTNCTDSSANISEIDLQYFGTFPRQAKFMILCGTFKAERK